MQKPTILARQYADRRDTGFHCNQRDYRGYFPSFPLCYPFLYVFVIAATVTITNYFSQHEHFLVGHHAVVVYHLLDVRQQGQQLFRLVYYLNDYRIVHRDAFDAQC